MTPKIIPEVWPGNNAVAGVNYRSQTIQGLILYKSTGPLPTT